MNVEKVCRNTANEQQLIVNYVPDNVTNARFSELFAKYEPSYIYLARKSDSNKTDGSNKDKEGHKGYGFVTVSNEMAPIVIAEMNGRMVDSKRLKVTMAKPREEVRLNSNVYIAGLPPTINEATLYQLGSPFGVILEYRLMKDAAMRNSLSTFSGFIRYNRRAEADAAISFLHGAPVNSSGQLLCKSHEEKDFAVANSIARGEAVFTLRTSFASDHRTRSKERNGEWIPDPCRDKTRDVLRDIKAAETRFRLLKLRNSSNSQESDANGGENTVDEVSNGTTSPRHPIVSMMSTSSSGNPTATEIGSSPTLRPDLSIPISNSVSIDGSFNVIESVGSLSHTSPSNLTSSVHHIPSPTHFNHISPKSAGVSQSSHRRVAQGTQHMIPGFSDVTIPLHTGSPHLHYTPSPPDSLAYSPVPSISLTHNNHSAAVHSPQNSVLQHGHVSHVGPAVYPPHPHHHPNLPPYNVSHYNPSNFLPGSQVQQSYPIIGGCGCPHCAQVAYVSSPTSSLALSPVNSGPASRDRQDSLQYGFAPGPAPQPSVSHPVYHYPNHPHSHPSQQKPIHHSHNGAHNFQHHSLATVAQSRNFGSAQVPLSATLNHLHVPNTPVDDNINRIIDRSAMDFGQLNLLDDSSSIHNSNLPTLGISHPNSVSDSQMKNYSNVPHMSNHSSEPPSGNSLTGFGWDNQIHDLDIQSFL